MLVAAGWLVQDVKQMNVSANQGVAVRELVMPEVDAADLWAPKDEAVRNLEASLAEDRPRALIQMSTGSGKTLLAAFQTYRLVKFAGAKRVLFLVDRANLGRQAHKEFQGFA